MLDIPCDDIVANCVEQAKDVRSVHRRRTIPPKTLLYDNRDKAGYDLYVSDPQPLDGGSLQVHQ